MIRARQVPALCTREFYGPIRSMSFTYVSVLTDHGMGKAPNSSVLAAAVSPWDRGAVRLLGSSSP